MNPFDLFNSGKLVTFITQPEENTDPIELLKLDASLSESHLSTLQVTEHPVEDGSSISDHTIKKPKTFTVDGIVSDDPITLAGAIVGTAAGVVGGMYDGIKGAVTTFGVAKVGQYLIGDSGKPSKTAYEALQSAQDFGWPLTVVTGLRTYNNMVLENLNIPRDSKTFRALRFTATLREVTIVESEEVIIPKTAISGAVSHSAHKKGKLGNQNATDAPDSVVSKANESVLSGLFG